MSRPETKRRNPIWIAPLSLWLFEPDDSGHWEETFIQTYGYAASFDLCLFRLLSTLSINKSPRCKLISGRDTQNKKACKKQAFLFYGSPGRTRTNDKRISSTQYALDYSYTSRGLILVDLLEFHLCTRHNLVDCLRNPFGLLPGGRIVQLLNHYGECQFVFVQNVSFVSSQWSLGSQAGAVYMIDKM